MSTAVEAPRKRIVASPSGWAVWGSVVIFMILVAGVVCSVLVNSFGTRWFGTWLPQGFTTRWYAEAWRDFGLFQVIVVTLEVAVAVVVLSVLIGVPASYVLARRTFPGKKLVYFMAPNTTPTRYIQQDGPDFKAALEKLDPTGWKVQKGVALFPKAESATKTG